LHQALDKNNVYAVIESDSEQNFDQEQKAVFVVHVTPLYAAFLK